MSYNITYIMWTTVPVAQWLEHCVSSTKVVGSIPREHIPTKKKSLWIKASAKCTNVLLIMFILVFWLQLGNTLNIHNNSVTEKCSNIVNMAMISMYFLMSKYLHFLRIFIRIGLQVFFSFQDFTSNLQWRPISSEIQRTDFLTLCVTAHLAYIRISK